MLNKIKPKLVGIIALLVGIVWCGESQALMPVGAFPIVVNVPVVGGAPVLATPANLTAYLGGLAPGALLNADVANLITWDIINRPLAFAGAAGPDHRPAIVAALAVGGGGGVVAMGILGPGLGGVGPINVPLLGVPGLIAVDFIVFPNGQVIVNAFFPAPPPAPPAPPASPAPPPPPPSPNPSSSVPNEQSYTSASLHTLSFHSQNGDE